MIAKPDLRPCAGEAELSDPAVTGAFAAEMARVAETPQVPPYCAYVLRRNGQPVGFGGFTGPPDEAGAVEIGYLTFPGHVDCGIATDVAAGLVEIARLAGAKRVVAHTLPRENPSTRVLAKNGFVRAGTDMDNDIGEAWRWELPLA